MKTLLLAACATALLPSIGFADEAHLIKSTIACDGVGWFMYRDGLRRDGDEVAVKKMTAHSLRTGECRMFKKGTRVIFHYITDYTDGDYGTYTRVRRAGDPNPMVLEKCALDGRDSNLLRFPGYVSPEQPCEEKEAEK